MGMFLHIPFGCDVKPSLDDIVLLDKGITTRTFYTSRFRSELMLPSFIYFWVQIWINVAKLSILLGSDVG